MSSRDDSILQLMQVSNADFDEARAALEANNWQLDFVLNQFLENGSLPLAAAGGARTSSLSSYNSQQPTTTSAAMTQCVFRFFDVFDCLNSFNFQRTAC